MKLVLAVDGGGSRGVGPLVVAAKIEELLGIPLYKILSLGVGTSTGGIIVAGLGNGMTAVELLNLYLEELDNIFKQSWKHKLSTLFGKVGPKYPIEPLVETLTKYFGNTKLSEAKFNVVTTAYDIELASIYLFKSHKAKYITECDFSLVDAAAATSAAPTYFPPHKITCSNIPTMPSKAMIDGGVFAGNPAMIALTEANKLWPKEEIVLISLGTGGAVSTYKWEKAKGWGPLNWVKAIIGIIFDGQIDTVSYHLERYMPEDNYFRWNPLLVRNIKMDTTKRDELEYVINQTKILLNNNPTHLKKMIGRITNAKQNS